MVKGLDLFRNAFRDYSNQYALIGGTAATLTMEDAGLAFRATKDLDVVLLVEALTPAFGAAFWAFIESGGYEIRQSSTTGKPCFYRFQKPSNNTYPAMIELFARAPDALRPMENSHLTPIPLGDEMSSLSAILLDDSYYAFIMEGRRAADGLAWVGEDRLIPLKAIAWLELRERKGRGEPIDSATVKKHLHDVLRLSQLFTPQTRIALKGRVLEDMRRFIDTAAAEPSLQPQALGIGMRLDDILRRIADAYALSNASPLMPATSTPQTLHTSPGTPGWPSPRG